jgi:elongation factor P
MITAGQFKKGIAINFESQQWIVMDYHIHKTAQRKPVLVTKLRNMKTGRVVEKGFDEADQFEQPDLQSRPHQYIYHDNTGYVFMDSETFEQIPISEELIGNGKWLLQENAEFIIRFLDGQPINVQFPPNFVDEVVDTADPSAAGKGASVGKDAKLACGLMIKVPMFISVGEHIKVDTETHEYMGKASEKK